MKKWLFIFLFTPAILQSAEIKEDSVIKMINQCWEITYSKPGKALEIAYEALSISKSNDFQNSIYNAHNHLGIIYDIQSDFDSSLHHYDQAIRISKALNDSVHQASTLSNIGLTYWHIGNYSLSLEYFYDALAIFESLSPESSGMVSVYNNLGMVYTELEDFENATVLFNKALNINSIVQDTLTEAAVYTNLGEVYKKQKQHQKAFHHYQRALNLKRLKADHYGLGLTHLDLTKLYIEMDSIYKARESLKECFKYCEKSGNKSQIAEAYLTTVELYEKSGEIKRPLRYARMALNIAQQIESKKLEYRSYKKMSELYAKKKDFTKAFEFQSKYNKLKDSLFNRHQLSYVYDLRLNHEIDKQTHEIALLDKLQKNQSLVIEKQKLKLQNRTFQLVIIAGIVVILSLWFYLRYIKVKYRDKQKSDAATIRRKQELSDRILQAEVNERTRISRDIHDSLGQYLALCKLKLSSLKSHKSNVHKKEIALDQSINLIDQTISEMRNIIQNLAPATLQKSGIKAALKELTERIKENHKLDIDLEISGEMNSLNYVMEDNLFRVIQEVFNNILKHSGADKITMQMIENYDDLTVMVEDNGSGFDLDNLKRKSGINNIFTRMENINGKAYFDSKINRGTIVSLIIPIKQEL